MELDETFLFFQLFHTIATSSSWPSSQVLLLTISKSRKPDSLRNIQLAPRLRVALEICAESGDFRTSVAIEWSMAASAEHTLSGIR